MALAFDLMREQTDRPGKAKAVTGARKPWQRNHLHLRICLQQIQDLFLVLPLIKGAGRINHHAAWL